MAGSIEIAKKLGKSSCYVDATIEDDGRVQMIQSSFGPAEETEFIVAVDSSNKAKLLDLLGGARGRKTEEEKDSLLLRLLEAKYRGNPNAVNDFMVFSAANGIRVTQARWP